MHARVEDAIRTGKDCGIGDPAARDGVAPRQVV
jgi:hypothetical protein